MSRIDGFVIDPSKIEYVCHDLSRPECIVAEANGDLWIADNRGSITWVQGSSGEQHLIGRQGGTPNGIAMTASGEFIVADISEGNVYRIDRLGNKKILLDRLEGERLGSVNFVYLDHQDRLWITVSTVTEPRSAALNSVVPDGYIVLFDSSGARRVADKLCFANEIRIDERGEYAYVAETAAGGVTRFKLESNGSLTSRETFGPMPLFEGAKVDGIAFDVDGNLWVTEITRHQIAVLKPDGSVQTLFEDPAGATIKFPTSIAFGGPDMRTVYVGSLTMDRIASFRSPVPGVPMRHGQVQE